MTIKKSDDRNYPYVICDGWEGCVFGDLEDLKDLKRQINKILKEAKAEKEEG